jgi:hypothetical protein
MPDVVLITLMLVALFAFAIVAFDFGADSRGAADEPWPTWPGY